MRQSKQFLSAILKRPHSALGYRLPAPETINALQEKLTVNLLSDRTNQAGPITGFPMSARGTSQTISARTGGSTAPEHGLAFFHEGRASFGIILAGEAFPHQRIEGGYVGVSGAQALEIVGCDHMKAVGDPTYKATVLDFLDQRP